MNRILQVVTIMDRGGAETLLMNLYRNVDRSEVQFDFLTHRLEKGAYDDEIKSMGGEIFNLPPIRPYRYNKYFKELDEFFSQHKEYKVVHSHINENSSFILRAARKSNIPIRITHSHLGSLPLDHKLPFRYYARHYLKGNATHYFACSKAAGKWLFGPSISNSGKVRVLNNGTDYTLFKYDNEIRNKFRQEMGLQDSFVIGHVGRFQAQKNHNFIVDIFKEVHILRPNAVLLLIGDGELKASIKKKVAKAGLADCVRFLGVRSDIPQLLQVMDLFLFPSIFEGLPVALVEAQAAGLHCIAADSVTAEADIGACLLNFLSLREPKTLWVDKIISMDISHIDSGKALTESGFDITEIARSLQDFYFDCHAASFTLHGANDVSLNNK